MSSTQHLRDLLLPELEAEMAKTRRALERVPEAQNDFKPHEKSMTLLALANHIATVTGGAAVVFSYPGLDATAPDNPRKIVREETPAGVLARFDELAEKNIAALGTVEDSAFADPWELKRNGQVMYAGTRYGAYRQLAINHMVHHRAQLNTYLRALDIAVPGMYGPSADEK